MARQGELFPASRGMAPFTPGTGATPALPLLQRQLIDWQERLAHHQGPLFAPTPHGSSPPEQTDLFASGGHPDGDPTGRAARLNPLTLTPQSLSFWRWPSPGHQGAALYLVCDRPSHLDHPLLLYVGETGQADRRWKGDHDCKSYLSAYEEALATAGLPCRLSIRFCCDVPPAIQPRRALEQALIRRWLPPFNKETRQRWATPFTSDPA